MSPNPATSGHRLVPPRLASSSRLASLDLPLLCFLLIAGLKCRRLQVHRHRGVTAESYTKPFVETEIYFIGRKKRAATAVAQNAPNISRTPHATPYGYGAS